MAASNNTGSLIKYGLIGVGGYFLWDWWQKRGSSPAAAVTPAAPTGVAFNSLDQIYQRLAAAVGTAQYTADGFNVYLAQQLAAGVAAPDPAAVFTAAGWNREAPMTLAQYWAGVAPYLKTNMGLSGLGVYGGLAAAMGGRH